MIRRYYENKNIKINTYLMQKLIDFEKDIYSNNSKKKNTTTKIRRNTIAA